MTEPNGMKPYRFIRLVYRRKTDLAEISVRLSERFTLIRPFVSKVNSYPAVELGSFEVKADTLYALLEADKATLFQKTRAPFTKKDLELRQTIFDLYPYHPHMPTNVLGREPEFDVEKA